MQQSGLHAWYLSGTDPHQSEYLPDHWNIRPFISGFAGSYGIVVVTLNEAALWTDSRYFLQAESQLQDTGIQLMKLRVEGTPSPAQWQANVLNTDEIVGTDTACLSVSQYQNFRNELAAANIQLKNCGDLLHSIWLDRPQLPSEPVFEHELQYAGKSRSAKIDEIRDKMKQAGAQLTLLTALDDIAWTFNLRGNDISYNPVFLAYALISESDVQLFVHPEKIPNELGMKLRQEGICLRAYDEIKNELQEWHGTVLIDPDRTNQELTEALAPEATMLKQLSPVTRLKAIKTEYEQEMIAQAMQKDGAAMVRFLKWLEETVGTQPVNEYDVLVKLEEFRAEQKGFIGSSFYPIVGYKENGAIVHRSVTQETAASIDADGILLFDSGGQYLEGTTDITRTVTLGNPTALEKEDFTLVLKGTIGLAELKFPANTPGCNLDLAARQALWQTGRNYGHGTGHGIGFFLNVHEGPVSIRQEYNSLPIEPGMVLSDEPAFYREGQYGIRTENVIVCREWQTTDYGRFLQFKTLTLCPIDTKLIDKQLLSPAEVEWINAYHQRCYNELAPLLTDEETVFLKRITQPI